MIYELSKTNNSLILVKSCLMKSGFERKDYLCLFVYCACISCDEKEKEIILERQSLSERQKALQQEQDRLLDAKALLNQREDYIFSRSQELNQLQKELENTRRDIEMERRAINAEKSNLELTEASLRTREEVHAFDFLFLSNFNYTCYWILYGDNIILDFFTGFK